MLLGCAPLPVATSFDPIDVLADPFGRARAIPGVAHLSSSREPEAPDGIGNRDFTQFVGMRGEEAILMQAAGPGVVTRLWITMSEGPDRSVSDERRLHVYVDGEEAVFVEGTRGITLRELTSGTLPSFPRPFVSSRAEASSAHAMWVPLSFQSSMEITLETAGYQTYYQIDWRSLRAGTVVPSFDGELSLADQARLRMAGETFASLAAGSMVTERLSDVSLEHPGPIVVTSVRIVAPDAAPLDPATRIDIVADDEVVFSGAPHRWVAGEVLPVAFSSAGTVVSESEIELRYPFPVLDQLRVTQTAGAPVDAWVTYVDTEEAHELRALRIRCEAMRSVDALRLLGPTIEGSGHLAGVSTYVAGDSSGWQMMEGDHEIEVDGTWALMGTGGEDYFGGAYYFQDGTYGLAFNGAPAFDLMGMPHLMAGVIDVALYRHLMLDRVDFTRSLRFGFENYVGGTTMDTCLFYYVDR